MRGIKYRITVYIKNGPIGLGERKRSTQRIGRHDIVLKKKEVRKDCNKKKTDL